MLEGRLAPVLIPDVYQILEVKIRLDNPAAIPGKISCLRRVAKMKP